jgi:hypothetical protein
MLLLAVASGGCGLAPHNSAREVGESFANALEGRSGLPMETYLAPDADVYLQGGLHLSRQAFRDHLNTMTAGYDFFHRMSRVFATRSGAGWLVDIIRAADATTAYSTQVNEPPPYWMEATIVSGRITRLWVHFTLETLLSIRQSPATYSAKMAAEGLPMPDDWSNGMAAMLAAAEAFDAQADSAQGPFSPTAAAPLTAVAAGLLIVRTLVARQRPSAQGVMAARIGERNHALLASVRARRERAVEEQEDEQSARSVPV